MRSLPQLIALLLAIHLGVAGRALAEIPKVALSEQHREMCKVGVGDPLPEIELATPNGDAQKLQPLYGKRATVLVLYTGDGWMTRLLLRDLSPDVAQAYGDRGVATLAVRVGAAAEPQPGQGCIQLVDANNAAAEKLGPGRLPRVYVIDADGKILWFDIEYSNSTRRELRQTLSTIVGEASQAVAEAPRAAR